MQSILCITWSMLHVPLYDIKLICMHHFEIHGICDKSIVVYLSTIVYNLEYMNFNVLDGGVALYVW